MKERGITLIALTVTIVILLIISSITITGAIKGVDETQENKVSTEMKMVQHAILERYTKYKLTKDENLLVGTVVSNANLPSLSEGNSWQATGSDESNQQYYELNKSDLQKLGLEPGKITNTSKYIVNYSTGEVYDSINQKYLSVKNTTSSE